MQWYKSFLLALAKLTAFLILLVGSIYVGLGWTLTCIGETNCQNGGMLPGIAQFAWFLLPVTVLIATIYLRWRKRSRI
ncbi:hypothetical protein HY346_01000 [Candidatus Microgenomates bacterium]|nr:hypothetical protein [Candidatus Microgenomates bacterium]